MSWSIEQGDSLVLLADMPNDAVDAVVTDPPYSSGGSFRSDRNGSAKGRRVVAAIGGPS